MNRQGGSRIRRGIRLSAAIVDGALSTALTAGLAARYVRPEVFWWPQAVALAVPALAVGVTVGGAWWAGRGLRSSKGRRTAWTLAVAHLSLAVVVPFREVGGERAAIAEGATMTVFSLNVGKVSEPRRLAGALDAVDPDVVALQEGGIRALPLTGVSGERVIATEPPVQIVLSRYETWLPPGSTKVVLRAPVFARDSVFEMRAAQLGQGSGAGVYSRSEIAWQGRRVAVYSLHLRSFGKARPWTDGGSGLGRWWRALGDFREGVVLRAREAERFRQVINAEVLPYLVLGDFNSTPHQWSYHRIASGHSDALRVAGQPFARTFPDAFPVVRIDGILASQHWKVRAAHVGPEGLSDHRAVIAEVALESDAPSNRSS